MCKLSRNLIDISKSHSESREGTHTQQLPSSIVAALTFKHHRETIISRHTHLAPRSSQKHQGENSNVDLCTTNVTCTEVKKSENN